MSSPDPGLIGNAVSAAAGLVGAVIGGVATYIAAMRQHRAEYAFRKDNALGAVLIEICQNQPGLAKALDDALPAWLARLDLRTPLGIASVREILAGARTFRTRIYDAMLPDLLTSEFASELMTYYDRIRWLNGIAPPHATLDPAYFRDYADTLSGALRFADDLVLELSKRRKTSRVQPWGKNHDVDAFLGSRDRNRCLAELTRHKLEELKAYLNDAKESGTLSKVCDRVTVQSYVDMAENP
jgi:hypothetical protein